jgi:hypothetical protein
MTFDPDDIKKAVKNNVTMAGAMRDLGTNRFQTHYRTMWKHIRDLKLDTSHWTSRKTKRPGQKIGPKIPLGE